ncbi:MAG TPA: trigger factor [Candidatus Binatia bacterium]|nr:trigger factor [Candidatus Binatia bacterium]
MEVKLETPGGLVRQVRVRIPADKVARAYDEQIRKIASRARLPGFRPGKAPLNVVQKQYGDSARMDVIQDLVRGSYPDAVTQAGVNPASAPSFEVTAEKPGEPLEYVARFEVYPEIKLRGLDQLKIEKPQVDVTEADVTKVVDSLKKARRALEPVERAAREGDVLQVDFEGSLDGQPFAGGKGENVEIEIGQKQFLPQLEQSLVGRRTDDAYDTAVDFPPDYGAENLRGKTAQFRVKVRSVREPKLPEVDAEFLKAHGVDESAGLAGLQGKVRAALETERDKAIQNRLKQQVLDQLLEANPIDVPQALVASETQRLREETAARFNAGKLKPEQKQKLLPDEMLAPQARRRVSLGLLIGEVIKQKQVQFDQARLDRLLDEVSADYQQPEQIRQYYRSRPDLLQGLRAIVLEEQMVDALISGVTPTEKALSLDELLGSKK